MKHILKNQKYPKTKGIKAAAARARKALGELEKLAKARRAEIQEKRTICNARNYRHSKFLTDELEETIKRVYDNTDEKTESQTNGEYGKVNM